MGKAKYKHLKKINFGLFVAIIIVNLYIILVPFLPGLEFWLQHQVYRSAESTLNQKVNNGRDDDNALVIPRLLLDKDINEGPDLATARKGIWHLPNTGNPKDGGNMVLVGHRFTYTNPRGIFYSLDKLKLGDQIAVFWQKERYVYSVKEIKVVAPNDSSIEAQTDENVLTLYTCTPLWSAKNRLVIVAKPSEPIYE